MNNIKEQFTIKDLENLSGVKAHTIRIWEKRYGLLAPQRTDTNIRYYDIASLQKLLNVSLLNSNGYKISKIANIPEDKISATVRELISKKGVNHHAINSFKLSMLNFDQKLFDHTYNQLLAQKSFREIFLNLFVDFLEEIGLLWQTSSITPAHEHFITNLIKQKIQLHLEKLQLQTPDKTNNVFVLFLPINEIHELGLLYAHLELMLHGYHSIYLGQSVPLSNLKALQQLHSKIVFVSYFTVYPLVEELNDYLSEVKQDVLRPEDEFWVLGKRLNEKEVEIQTYPQLKSFVKLTDFIKQL